MKIKPFKSKLDKATGVHEMVKSGMPHYLARTVVSRKPIGLVKKKKQV